MRLKKLVNKYVSCQLELKIVDLNTDNYYTVKSVYNVYNIPLKLLLKKVDRIDVDNRRLVIYVK